MNKLLQTITLSLLTLVLFTTASCIKEQHEKRHSDRLQATATVLNTGSPASDGCGWLIKIGDTRYSPDNLSQNFQINDIQVKIVYTISDAYFDCGFGGSNIKYIHLYDIKR